MESFKQNIGCLMISRIKEIQRKLKKSNLDLVFQSFFRVQNEAKDNSLLSSHLHVNIVLLIFYLVL